MRFADYIAIALRNIMRQKLRSALTIFAVVIGATSVTIMLAMVFGARGFFMKQMEAAGVLQQVAVSSKQDITDFNDAQHGNGNCSTCIKLTDDLVDKIKALPHVQAVSRQMFAGQFEALVYNGKKLSLQDIEAADMNGVVHNTILAGRDLTQADKQDVVVVTADYADKFGFKNNYQAFVGKRIQLQSQQFYTGVGAKIFNPADQPHNSAGGLDPGQQPPQQQPTLLTATVVGVQDTQDRNAMVRVPIDWAKQMNVNRRYDMTDADRKAAENYCRNWRGGGPCNPPQHMTLVTEDFTKTNGYNGLTVKADSTQNAAAVAAAIRKLGVGAADAESMIKSQMQIFNILGLVLGGIGGISLAVAAIGVINTMIMSILERTREIGVMRAVGARRATVSLLFTIEASLLGFWGGVFGVAAGYGLTRLANVFINKQLAGQGMLVRNIIGLPLWLIGAVVGITTIIGLLAGLYPARRAARLDPVEALHYE